ncbi:MAG: DUF1232 domain-containing protein [Bacteroidaceae bacterium]|nr:DUF1232 domain-containing protein [Bacteroidaceae bacterium]
MLNKLKNAAAGAKAKVKETADKASQAIGENLAVVNVDELKAKAASAIEENAAAFAKYFSESKLVEKLQKTAKAAGATVLYPAMMLWKLFQSDSVPAGKKTLIVGALGYFILPIDLIPDALLGTGYADDAAALMACLKAVLENITTDVPLVAKKELHDLMGDFDDSTLDAIDKVLKVGNKIVN